MLSGVLGSPPIQRAPPLSIGPFDFLLAESRGITVDGGMAGREGKDREGRDGGETHAGYAPVMRLYQPEEAGKRVRSDSGNRRDRETRE